ncbi:Uncharacterized membrane protein YcfT [Cohaesibacter sp. ES.047]|uniref:acyltransferase family protein n=1 Tax=Cohaesibacter sp. ES.047 TaxID=1798205 RepID=UPI000BBFA880|nr:acyltransferase family protein [Cohaesibacter sp. ES.047]SNY90167.1 Uncharacterized membrane protein YcfT [Cohaesibacter sp. ES.047]
MAQQPVANKQRIEWIDLAKGLTILLVVIMHSTGGVELHFDSEGWMHHVLAFATPFRMPVFFAVAGLFAANAISKDWRTFLDSKFVHFAYFYVIWMTIQFIFKTPFFIQTLGSEGTLSYYIASFVQPFGLLWFIYLLPIYFLVLRVTKPVPMLAQFVIAIACKAYLTHTGINVVDFFSKYYVFFLAGHFGRDLWFSLAGAADRNRYTVFAGLSLWAGVNGAVVYLGYGDILPVTILMGVLGFVAVIGLIAIVPKSGLAGTPAHLLRFCGQRSLPIYLGFFLPMGVSRLALSRFTDVIDVGTIAFLVSLTAIAGAIVMFEAVKRLKIGTFLYVRPEWARLRLRRVEMVPAE